MLLDRSGDPGETFTGQMAIAEPIPGFENVTAQPQVPVKLVRKLTSRDQHWQIVLDKDGVIGPDGQPIQHDTIVSGSGGNLVAVLDSGFTVRCAAALRRAVRR
jgi:hypothetical protein